MDAVDSGRWKLLQSKYLGVALSVSKAYYPCGLFRRVCCLSAVQGRIRGWGGGGGGGGGVFGVLK